MKEVVAYISTEKVTNQREVFVTLSNVRAGLTHATAGRQKQDDQSVTTILRQPKR